MTAAPPTDPIAELAELVVAHLNHDHLDSLLLIGRCQGGRPDARRVVAVGIDGTGLDLQVDDDAGPTRIPWPEPVADLVAVRGRSVALVRQARAALGVTELTVVERELAQVTSIRTFVTSVVAVEQVTPLVRQLTFGGGDLVDFAPLSADTFVYVLAPPRGRTELTIDRSFSWEAYTLMPPEEQPIGAYYTVRRWRADAHELDAHFVLHGDPDGHAHGEGGEASAWAARAQVGDPVALWGPREAYLPPDGTTHHLLVADETGLPGLAAIIESLPAGAPVTAIVEVPDEAERQPLADHVDLDVTWIHRDGAEAGTTTNLVEAVAALGELPPGTYAWGAGESRAVTAVRKLLRNERGLARPAVSMTGYWRHQAHALDPDDDD